MTFALLLFLMGCNKSTPPTSSVTSIEKHMSLDKPKRIYLQWLSAKGDHADFVTAGTPLGASPERWSFFYVRHFPGDKEFPAGVHASGILVTAGEQTGWFDLLSTSQDIGHLHNQIAWLHGRWVTIVPSSSNFNMVLENHPDALEHVTEPEVILENEEMHFSAWFYAPPYGPLFQFQIVASQNQETTFHLTNLDEILGTP